MNKQDFSIPKEFQKLLRPIRQKQIELASELSFIPSISFQDIKTIAALDVAYSEEEDFACAGIVVVDFRTFEVLDEQTEFFKPPIPYIPTFLHYRESPGYHAVLKKLVEKPDILMFDGNGILHPFGNGLASQMGLETRIPSFGIAKKLLLGDYELPLGKGGFSEISSEGEIIGAAFQTLDPPANPIFISPGHLINLNICVNIMRDFVLHQKFPSKLPLPLNLADRLARDKLEGKVKK